MQENNKIEELIVKYLEGSVSGEELIIIAEWLKEDTQHIEVFKQMVSYWRADVTLDIDINFSNILSDIDSRIAKSKKQIHRRKISLTILSSAASVLFAIALAYTLLYKEPPTQIYTYLSGEGVSVIELPDGTLVSLNRDSKLEYENKAKERFVSLEGEAYFDVTKNPKLPFIVNMSETSVQVLGTSFNIRNRKEEPESSVTLVSGLVRFNAPSLNLEMEPNQHLVYNRENQEIEINKANLISILAWKDHLIKYNRLAFIDIIGMLEKQYNVKIEVKGSESLRNTLMTGTFDSHLELDAILNIMKNNVDFEWKKTTQNTYLVTNR